MPHSGEYPRLHPLQHDRCTETKKYGPNERRDKTPKIELSNENIDNQSHAEFKTLVIRLLTEMVECGCKIEGKVKSMKSEIKIYIYREPTVKSRTPGRKSTIWTIRKK